MLDDAKERENPFSSLQPRPKKPKHRPNRSLQSRTEMRSEAREARALGLKPPFPAFLASPHSPF